MKSLLYVDLWEKYLFAINSIVKNGGGVIQLCSLDFEQRGKRKSYSVSLDIVDGIIPFKSGNAVARDLKMVLDASPAFRENAKGKRIIIRLDPQFLLTIRVYDY